MSVKKIVAPDMRQALKKVRDQMGADAVILSNRKVPAGVEITASVDYQAVLDAHQQKERERKHVPAFVDENVEMVPAQGNEHDVIKRDLEAAKEKASRRQLREQFAQERNKRVAMHEGLVENLQGQIAEPAPDMPPARMSNPNTAYGLEDDRVSIKAKEYDPEEEFFAQIERDNEQAEVERQIHEPDAFVDPVSALQNHVDARMNANTSKEDINDVKQELNQLKSILSSQLNNMSWGDYSYRKPLSAAVFKRLRKIGLSSPLCRSLLNQVDETLPKKEAWRRVLEDLSSRLPISYDEIINGSGVVAFVGPAGVGKTTTIAKLAAEYALKHGPESLALISTDSYRIAGHEQLRTLAQILKVPLRIANEQNPLDAVVRSLSRKKMVLIDTAGLSVKDDSFDHQMNLLEQSQIEMKNWLVLSGTSQRKILEKTVNEYKHLNLTGSILTKLDESASLGEALSVIVENKLPMAYVTNGQNIPDDIQRPKANQLINLAVSLSKEADCEESEIADMFAEVMVV